MLEPSTPIRFVPGVGPKRAELFRKLAVHDVEDLLNHFPRDGILPGDCVDIDQLKAGKDAVVVGEITKAEYISYGRMPRMRITINDGTGELQAIWFNGGYLRNMLRVGENGAGKTEIMYSANMSYSQIQRYLGFLISQGFIYKVEADNPVVTYHLTDSGAKLLKTINNLIDMLGLNNEDDNY